jgi:hypothetical protein
MAAGFQVIDDSSTDRTITAFQVIDAAGVDRTIVEGRVIGPDRGDRVFWDTAGTSSFAGSASPTGVHGAGNATATTNATTATVTGGTPPYSHAWSIVSHTNSTLPTINTPAGATTTFTQTNIAAGNVDDAVFRDTVTDSATPANSTTIDVSAAFLDTSTL